MDAGALVTIAATAIGTAAATYGATWAKLTKPLNDRIEKQEKGSVDTEDYNRVKADVQELKGLNKDIDELKSVLKDLRDTLQHCVSDDEFASYTSQTTTLLNGLTEKVGRALGVMEAWTQTTRR